MVIENNILRSISEKCWRKIINGAIVIGAVCASPASGGTSLAVLTESVATINLGVALYDNQIEAEKEKLTPSEYTSNAEFYTRWEQLRSAALIADMGIGATNILYKALPKIGAKLNVRASNQNPH